jgi:hypothetical protein
MILTQALKENMGDPERRTWTELFATSPEKKENREASQKTSSQAFRKSD